MAGKLRIAIVVSHPIQHFCPQYASFAKHDQADLKVFFASSLGHKAYFDPNFKQNISWDNLRLNEFDHEFLNDGQALQPDASLDAPMIGEALEKFNPDVVVIYGYFQKFQRRVRRWAKSAKVRIAYISDTEMKQQRSKLKEIIKYPIIRRFFSGIDHVLTVGNANEDYYAYAGVPRSKMIRMHFPIDIELYKNSFSKRDELAQLVRQQNNIAHDGFVASVAGKLVGWKSQDHIIDAMIKLEAEGVIMHLFILGSGEMLDQLKAKAQQLKKSKVHFAGFVQPTDLPAYYAASDVYIHPAAIEPHSLAISEAIYMGCPVIISDRCGSYGESDDVQEGKNGFVYPFGNIGVLSEKIKWMMQHAAEREQFGLYSHTIAKLHQEKAHGLVLNDLYMRIHYAQELEETSL